MFFVQIRRVALQNAQVREYLQGLTGGNVPELSNAEFKRLSGRGNSRGWRFDRDEVHERS